MDTLARAPGGQMRRRDAGDVGHRRGFRASPGTRPPAAACRPAAKCEFISARALSLGGHPNAESFFLGAGLSPARPVASTAIAKPDCASHRVFIYRALVNDRKNPVLELHVHSERNFIALYRPVKPAFSKASPVGSSDLFSFLGKDDGRSGCASRSLDLKIPGTGNIWGSERRSADIRPDRCELEDKQDER